MPIFIETSTGPVSVFDSGHVPHTTDPDRLAGEFRKFIENTCGHVLEAA